MDSISWCRKWFNTLCLGSDPVILYSDTEAGRLLWCTAIKVAKREILFWAVWTYQMSLVLRVRSLITQHINGYFLVLFVCGFFFCFIPLNVSKRSCVRCLYCFQSENSEKRGLERLPRFDVQAQDIQVVCCKKLLDKHRLIHVLHAGWLLWWTGVPYYEAGTGLCHAIRLNGVNRKRPIGLSAVSHCSNYYSEQVSETDGASS